jgi:hypothetical protein
VAYARRLLRKHAEAEARRARREAKRAARERGAAAAAAGGGGGGAGESVGALGEEKRADDGAGARRSPAGFP